ncbi:MAG: hypothetical protein MZV70_40410 [Desulfobacterales bacterium]|nr:hypothetical protein [Desulfobacterales bacterium]
MKSADVGPADHRHRQPGRCSGPIRHGQGQRAAGLHGREAGRAAGGPASRSRARALDNPEGESTSRRKTTRSAAIRDVRGRPRARRRPEVLESCVPVTRLTLVIRN